VDRGRLLFTSIGHGKRERYFDNVTVEQVRSEEGWKMIGDKPQLWGGHF
jgi:hypothetical protein